MRKKRDAEDTKNKVLSAAEQLFAAKGFRATSISDIAAESGISNGLILYHYQSKKNLYEQVKKNISARYGQMLIDLHEKNLSPKDMMKAAVNDVFQFWQKDTVYKRISLWSYLEGDDEISESESKLTTGLSAYLMEMEKNGLFTSDIHPAVFLSMIIGPIHFWTRYKENFYSLFSSRPEELDRVFIENFQDVLSSYFK